MKKTQKNRPQRKTSAQRTEAVTWLSNYPCKGINFRLGDNGVQLFYEAVVRGITWMVLRPKSSRYWCCIAEYKGSYRVLDSCHKHWDDTVELDPLYQEKGCDEDIPITLLEPLADYINSGSDPFTRESQTQLPPPKFELRTIVRCSSKSGCKLAGENAAVIDRFYVSNKTGAGWVYKLVSEQLDSPINIGEQWLEPLL